MKIENLWSELINEGYTQIWLYDGPCPSDTSRIVVLLDKYGGEIALRTNLTDDKSWKMVVIRQLKGFSQLPKESLSIELNGVYENDSFALIMAESAGRPQKMEKPHLYR